MINPEALAALGAVSIPGTRGLGINVHGRRIMGLMENWALCSDEVSRLIPASYSLPPQSQNPQRLFPQGKGWPADNLPAGKGD